MRIRCWNDVGMDDLMEILFGFHQLSKMNERIHFVDLKEEREEEQRREGGRRGSVVIDFLFLSIFVIITKRIGTRRSLQQLLQMSQLVMQLKHTLSLLKEIFVVLTLEKFFDDARRFLVTLNEEENVSDRSMDG